MYLRVTLIVILAFVSAESHAQFRKNKKKVNKETEDQQPTSLEGTQKDRRMDWSRSTMTVWPVWKKRGERVNAPWKNHNTPILCISVTNIHLKKGNLPG